MSLLVRTMVRTTLFAPASRLPARAAAGRGRAADVIYARTMRARPKTMSSRSAARRAQSSNWNWAAVEIARKELAVHETATAWTVVRSNDDHSLPVPGLARGATCTCCTRTTREDGKVCRRAAGHRARARRGCRRDRRRRTADPHEMSIRGSSPNSADLRALARLHLFTEMRQSSPTKSYYIIRVMRSGERPGR